ncbi:hypothetical protein NQ176_g8080 [Zarea fungicola]|uniref:Uncharacterized protein n=1 Tax=Zarea fungicola TaxID=93591 RepID=A0ACC1MV90_9HYPO|nr:hypothetical protein NQ176_g8080 [Lecanicillium fungicola]
MGLVVLSFGGAAIFRAFSKQLENDFNIQIRGGLASQLLIKSYRLELSGAKRQEVLALVKFLETFEISTCVAIPCTVLEAGAAMFCLATFIKQYAFIIFIPVFISTMAGAIFDRYTTPARHHWHKNMETKLSKTLRALSQLSAIRILGLSPKISLYIQHLQIVELEYSKIFRCLQAVSLGVVVAVDLLTSVIVIAAGVFSDSFGDTLSPTDVYPVLGIVSCVQERIAGIINNYPQVMSMLGYFERVQLFLEQPEHEDPRQVLVSRPNSYELSLGTSLCCVPPASAQQAQRSLPDTGYVLSFANAAIAPRGEFLAILEDVDFSVAYDSILAMFGPAGSGKTTLLQGMMGESEILHGSIFIGEISIAFCGQLTCLPALTLRRSIVGAYDYDSAWFDIVIERCRLRADVEELGQDNIIPHNGSGLSAGILQKIGIARAVYSRSKLLLFDDVFCSLNRQAAVDLLLSLCGKGGLLRDLKRTVILSSYMPECLDVADQLLLLDGNGSVFCETNETSSDLRVEITSLLEDRHIHTSPNLGNPYVSIQPVAQVPYRADTKLLISWFHEIGLRRVIPWFLLVFVMSVAEAIDSSYMASWLGPTPTDRHFLIGYALISTSAGILSSICLISLFVQLTPRAVTAVHYKLTNYILRSKKAFADNAVRDTILNLYSHDIDRISKDMPGLVYSVFYCGTTVFVGILTIFYGSGFWVMSGAVVLVLFALCSIQSYHSQAQQFLQLMDSRAWESVLTTLAEVSTDLICIRGQARQQYHLARGLQMLDGAQSTLCLLISAPQFLLLVLDLLTALIAIAVLWLSFSTKGAYSPNLIGLAFSQIICTRPCIFRTIYFWTLLDIKAGPLSKLWTFLDSAPIDPGREIVHLPLEWPSKGKVELSSVFARYKPDNEVPLTPVIRNISLSISQGQKIGVTGPPGCGKSSLLLTLLGFLDYEGSIIIDDVDIATLTIDQLTSRIITITQDVVELDGTIRDNLLPFNTSWEYGVVPEKSTNDMSAYDQIVRETLVRLRIWDQAETRGGLDALFEDVDYSYGEKQLLGIARAVIRRRLTGSNLLLVDESSNRNDPWRDQVLREVMREYFLGCTIIVVSRRQESIMDSNITLHMSNGLIQQADDFS